MRANCGINRLGRDAALPDQPFAILANQIVFFPNHASPLDIMDLSLLYFSTKRPSRIREKTQRKPHAVFHKLAVPGKKPEMM
jgi:hypothetical protein